MKKNSNLLELTAFLSLLFLWNTVFAEVERHPTAIGSSVDIGQIVKGMLVDNSSGSDTVSGDGQLLTRTGVYVAQSATINQQFDIHLTFGGLFYFALPEKAVEPGNRFVQFGLGVGQAQGVYTFGDKENPRATFRFGLFPVKYNSDAKNLGEYLFRSVAYPTILYNGGWSYFNSASYMAQGMQLTWNTFDGALVHNFVLPMERDFSPHFDFSPAYVATWKPTSFFEFGFGAQWSHAIPIRPSLSSPTNPENAYIKNTGMPFNYGPEAEKDINAPGYSNVNAAVVEAFVDGSGNGVPVSQLTWDAINEVFVDGVGTPVAPNPQLGLPVDPADPTSAVYVARNVFAVPDQFPLDPVNDPYGLNGNVKNPLIGQVVPGKSGAIYVSGNDINEFNINGTPKDELDYYTFEAIKVMLRASLDFGVLMGMEANLFKLYGETALLGIEDQPFYYEKKSERTPFMLGIDVPTLGLLDAFGVEVEYLNSRFPNNLKVLYSEKWPLPLADKKDEPSRYNPDDPRYAPGVVSYVQDNLGNYSVRPDWNTMENKFVKDDLKWSIYARKQFTKGVSVHAQAASDHSRQLTWWGYGPRLMDHPSTRYTSEWYYMFRVEFGI